MKGILISKLILCLPNKFHFTDASRRAMGGFNMNSGQTWNYLFPTDILKFTSINYLEFLAVIVELLLVEYLVEESDHLLL